MMKLHLQMESNSENQDYYMFSEGGSYEPSYATVTERGPHPRYSVVSGNGAGNSTRNMIFC